MTKYYYDCPIKAALMAKTFEMVFTDKEGHALEIFNDADPATWFYVSSKETGYMRPQSHEYYIHPDSLHLLEPQEGDYGLDTRFSCVAQIIMLNGELVCFDGEQNWGTKHFQTLQRNGKSFIWPESEDV